MLVGDHVTVRIPTSMLVNGNVTHPVRLHILRYTCRSGRPAPLNSIRMAPSRKHHVGEASTVETKHDRCARDVAELLSERTAEVQQSSSI